MFVGQQRLDEVRKNVNEALREVEKLGGKGIDLTKVHNRLYWAVVDLDALTAQLKND